MTYKKYSKKVIASLNDTEKQEYFQSYFYEQYHDISLLILSAFRDDMAFIPLGEYLESMFRADVEEDYLSADTLHIQMGLADDLRMMCETLGYFRGGGKQCLRAGRLCEKTRVRGCSISFPPPPPSPLSPPEGGTKEN